MVIKVRGLTWAKVSGGGSGSAVTYTGGKVQPDMIVRVDQNEETSQVKFHADDHQIDRDNTMNGASVSFELAKLTDEMKQEWLGYESITDGLRRGDAESPYVGVGFIYGSRFKGVNTFKAYWYYKVQFTLGQRSFNTKGETTAFQTESADGEAMAVELDNSGKVYFFEESAELETEAAARAWLNGRAGVSG